MPWTKITALLFAALLAGSCSAAQTTAPGNIEATMTHTTRQNVSYADGTYSATGWYGSLPSSITVTLTLKDTLITNVSVQTHATDPTSLDYQRRFAAAVPKVVVGRPVGAVKVGKLAGASGTPDGFNDALRKIKAEAGK